jgi:beta-xylosidase
MSADGRTLLDDGVEIYRGEVAEGPKIYKRNGTYYISLPEGGVDTGWQTVLRSTNLYGPYEARVVLPAGSPHQGGLVDLPDGSSWFIGFKTTGSLGRIDYLEPVRWDADGWPVFGDNGQPVVSWTKPAVGPPQPPSRPRVSDDFAGTRLDPIWQWNHNPVSANWSLAERPGFLRLRASPATAIDLARNTLTQKLWDVAGTVEVRMRVEEMADGQRAGLTFISGRSFGWAGVAMDAGLRRVAWSGGGAGPIVPGGEVRFRGRYEGDRARLFYSLDAGGSWTDTGISFTLAFEYWKGARVGLFSYGPAGAADFYSFRYTYGDR